MDFEILSNFLTEEVPAIQQEPDRTTKEAFVCIIVDSICFLLLLSAVATRQDNCTFLNQPISEAARCCERQKGGRSFSMAKESCQSPGSIRFPSTSHTLRWKQSAGVYHMFPPTSQQCKERSLSFLSGKFSSLNQFSLIWPQERYSNLWYAYWAVQLPEADSKYGFGLFSALPVEQETMLHVAIMNLKNLPLTQTDALDLIEKMILRAFTLANSVDEFILYLTDNRQRMNGIYQSLTTIIKFWWGRYSKSLITVPVAPALNNWRGYQYLLTPTTSGGYTNPPISTDILGLFHPNVPILL